MPNLMTCNDSKFTIRMVVRIAAAVIVYLDEGLRKKMVVAICSRDRDALQLMTRKTTKIGDGAKSYTVTSPLTRRAVVGLKAPCMIPFI